MEGEQKNIPKSENKPISRMEEEQKNILKSENKPISRMEGGPNTLSRFNLNMQQLPRYNPTVEQIKLNKQQVPKYNPTVEQNQLNKLNKSNTPKLNMTNSESSSEEHKPYIHNRPYLNNITFVTYDDYGKAYINNLDTGEKNELQIVGNNALVPIPNKNIPDMANTNKNGNLIHALSSEGIERSSMRSQNGVLENEMIYNDYNRLPLDNNLGNKEWDYGYTFMPPANWYPTPPNPPLCVTEKKCPVCPVFTDGTSLELKEWEDSRRVTQPDNIDVKFIREKLNAGR